MTLVVLVVAGLVTGAVLGAVGGGGAVLTVPVLVYVIGQNAQEATTASLVIVGATAVVGVIGHAKAGNVRWRVGLAFGAAGAASAVIGAHMNRAADERLLMLGFAVVMALAATGMLTRGGGETGDAADEGAAGGDVPSDAAAVATTAADVPNAGAATTLVGPAMTSTPSRKAVAANVVAAGLVVGFLTGLLGVGGGFVIVPALVLALRFAMPVAVGTSLLVVALNSAVALIARAGHAHVDWTVVVPFTAVAVVAALAGQRLARRVSSLTLTRSFAVLLLVVAIFVAGHSLVTLA